MILNSIKQHLSWWSKIVAKLLLSRFPLSYSVWQKLNLFRHGNMNSLGCALSVFDAHLSQSGLKGCLLGRTHLGDALNNLRFSEQIWESNFFKSLCFYKNCIRYSDILKTFEAAGFIVEKTEVQRWYKLPTAREKLAPQFLYMPEDDLCIRVLDVCLRVPKYEAL